MSSTSTTITLGCCGRCDAAWLVAPAPVRASNMPPASSVHAGAGSGNGNPGRIELTPPLAGGHCGWGYSDRIQATAKKVFSDGSSDTFGRNAVFRGPVGRRPRGAAAGGGGGGGRGPGGGAG